MLSISNLDSAFASDLVDVDTVVLLSGGDNQIDVRHTLSPCVKKLFLKNAPYRFVAGSIGGRVEILVFDCEYDYDIHSDVIPPDLHYLEFAQYYNKTISLSGCNNIRTLLLTHGYDRRIECDTLPPGLTHLKLGDSFNQEITPNVLPQSLLHIEFGRKFDRDIITGTLPYGLRSIIFNNNYNRELYPSVLPDTIQHISCGMSLFTDESAIPSSLTTLTIYAISDVMIDVLQHIPLHVNIVYANTYNYLTRDALDQTRHRIYVSDNLGYYGLCMADYIMDEVYQDNNSYHNPYTPHRYEHVRADTTVCENVLVGVVLAGNDCRRFSSQRIKSATK